SCQGDRSASSILVGSTDGRPAGQTGGVRLSVVQAADVETVRVKRPKDRKAQIALAAAELFCQYGYHGVGVDEIAAAVGISGPAVYRHFPNKYAVLVHASRELLDTLLAAAADPGTGDPAAVLDERL